MRNFVQSWLFELWQLIRSNSKVALLLANLKEKTEPLVDRWKTLSLREKRLLGGLAAICSIMVMFSIISGAISWANNLEVRYDKLQEFKLTSEFLKKEYSDLSMVTANEFSAVDLARIQGDIKDGLHVNNANVVLQDNLLVIKADNVLFDSVILLLDQLRKSYGIYPSKLKITQSGARYVDLNVTFAVSN
jgi:type II secretory pathway component PulM